nr:MFS transporter [Georgenia sp. SYP-B2076]
MYALLFADAGLSDAQISALFAIWSAVAVLAEVPTGLLADRFSRRASLVAATTVQAAGFALWIVVPDFTGFAAGFVLWAIGGACSSGALEALLYDGLAAVRAEAHYARLLGRVTSAGLLAQLPAAVAAAVLFGVGGYALAGWVSVGCCLAAAALATTLPEPPRASVVRTREPDDAGRGYVATVAAEVRGIAARPGVRGAVVAVALLTAVDGLEEYFPLAARDMGLPVAGIPVALMAIPVAGAAGAALGGAARLRRPLLLATLLGIAALVLGVAGSTPHVAGLVGVAAFYGVYRMVLVAVDARLQERIPSALRATVTSVAGLGSEVATFAVYGAWAAGRLTAAAALVAALAVALPVLLRGSAVGVARARAGRSRGPAQGGPR